MIKFDQCRRYAPGTFLVEAETFIRNHEIVQVNNKRKVLLCNIYKPKKICYFVNGATNNGRRLPAQEGLCPSSFLGKGVVRMNVTAEDFYQMLLTINMIVSFVYKIYRRHKNNRLVRKRLLQKYNHSLRATVYRQHLFDFIISFINVKSIKKEKSSGLFANSSNESNSI